MIYENEEISILSLEIQPILFKHDLGQMKKFMDYRSTCRLYVLIIGSKHDSPQMRKFAYWLSNY